MADNTKWLGGFYGSLCDGDWEHGTGCSIKSIDNPGWKFSFNLSNTVFENIEFETIVDLRSELDWINCAKEGDIFLAIGGPLNLDEMIGIFRAWIEKSDF